MAPKVRVTREQILAAGLALARTGGPEAVNARAVAAALGCSTQPIFSNYASMEALQRDVLARAQAEADRYMAQPRPGESPYKAVGMGYIRFAAQEPALFRWLYMRDRSREPARDDREDNAAVLRLIMDRTGLSEDRAWRFHQEMWLFVHGLAAAAATGYARWPEEQVGGMVTDVFEGLRARFAEKEG